MKEILLAKLGEIALKGLNRREFENVLLKNIRRRLSHCGKFNITSAQSTIYIEPADEQTGVDSACECISRIFGIVGYTRAAVCEKDMDDIKKTAAEYLGAELRTVGSFKVECKRSDKKFPLKSPEIAAQLGEYIFESFENLRVDVHNPDETVWVEIREEHAYIHTNAKEGAGGIPVGTGGRAAVLISGGLDSPVAAWMMAKRGVELVAVHFASPPYTSEAARDKVVRLLRKVSAYAGRMKMITVNFTHLQEEIRDICPEELGTLILRRFMLMAAEKIALDENCDALITGESLGQVASQTMKAIACTDAVCSMPVFRPLIGADKAEIVKLAYKIDTFDISIEPFEDCCTIFTPRHPRTRPTLGVVENAEGKLDVQELLEEALASVSSEEIK